MMQISENVTLIYGKTNKIGMWKCPCGKMSDTRFCTWIPPFQRW